MYVFASKSYKDAKKVLGAGLAQHEVHFVVTTRVEFAEMIESAKSAQEWLAKKVPEWNGRYLGTREANPDKSTGGSPS